MLSNNNDIVIRLMVERLKTFKSKISYERMNKILASGISIWSTVLKIRKMNRFEMSM